MFKTDEGFNKLFWRYWSWLGDHWKCLDPEFAKNRAPEEAQFLSAMAGNKEARRAVRSRLVTKWQEQKLSARDIKEQARRYRAFTWETHGRNTLGGWRRSGLCPREFLEIESFRREHDLRARNLTEARTKGRVNSVTDRRTIGR